MFLPNKKDLLRSFAFDLKEKKNRIVHFRVYVKDKKGSKIVLKNFINVSKIENESLGFSYELGLMP